MADINIFLKRFPEFDGQGKNLTLIKAKIDEATRRTDPTLASDLADDITYYLAAHLLAQSPMGQNAKLVAKDGSTTYGKEYKRLCRLVSMGFRVA